MLTSMRMPRCLSQVLPPLEPPAYTLIEVKGKSPDEVCDVIISGVGEAVSTGCVIVLCGLSGTGKGTTVAKLQKRLPVSSVVHSAPVLDVQSCPQPC